MSFKNRGSTAFYECYIVILILHSNVIGPMTILCRDHCVKLIYDGQQSLFGIAVI